MGYTDLTTYAALIQADDSRSVVDDLDNLQDEAEAVIADVSDLVDAYLGLGAQNQGSIVRKYQQAIAGRHWTVSDYDPSVYVAWADQAPVVEMDLTSDDISDVSASRHTDRKLALDDNREAGTVTYFGGYRRPDQVLSNPGSDENKLPTADGEALDGLSTLPPVLPRQIRMTAINITLHVLQNRAQGNLGRRVQQSFGNQQITVDGADSQYVNRQLGRLESAPNRRLVV